MIKVNDLVVKEYDSVMNSVNFDHEYSLSTSIVQLPTVQNAEVVIIEETSSKNKERYCFRGIDRWRHH